SHSVFCVLVSFPTRRSSDLSVLCLFLLSACQEEEYMIPELEPGLHNDVIKRTLGPNVVGLDIEFAYAMALPREEGRIVSAQVDRSEEHTSELQSRENLVCRL